MDLNSILGSVGLSNKFSLDVALAIMVAAATLVFGLIFGRGKLASILVTTYVAAAIVGAVSENILSDYFYRLMLFIALIVIVVFLGNKFYSASFSNIGYGFTWDVFAMSFFEVMLILAIVLTIVPQKIASGFVSPIAFEYIAIGYAKIFWMVAPLIFLLAINRKSGR